MDRDTHGHQAERQVVATDVVGFVVLDEYPAKVGQERQAGDHRPDCDGPEAQTGPQQPDQRHSAERVVDVFIDVVRRDGLYDHVRDQPHGDAEHKGRVGSSSGAD